jgi:hypothetical protein
MRAAAGLTNAAPQRAGRQAFVSIPELDEDLDLNMYGDVDDDDDLALGSVSPTLKAPTTAAKSLAHSMTKTLLGNAMRSRGANARAAVDATAANAPGERAPPPPPLAGELGTPRGGESEALARLDYDTSQTLTQFSDAEHRTLAPYVLDGLEGLPPPREDVSEPDASVRGGRAALRAALAERGSVLLSPRDKGAMRRALSRQGLLGSCAKSLCGN